MISGNAFEERVPGYPRSLLFPCGISWIFSASDALKRFSLCLVYGLGGPSSSEIQREKLYQVLYVVWAVSRCFKYIEAGF